MGRSRSPRNNRRGFSSCVLPKTNRSSYYHSPTYQVAHWKIFPRQIYFSRRRRYARVKGFSTLTLVVNIDVGFVGLVGFHASEAPASHIPLEIPEEFGVEHKLKPWNVFNSNFVDDWEQSVSICYLGDEEEHLNVLKPLANEIHVLYPNDYLIFHFPSTNPLTGRIRENFGLKDTCLAIISQATDVYVCPGISTESVKEFLVAYRAGEVKKTLKSQERAPNDREPDHPSLYRITASNFDELINSDKDFLVDVWAPWCGPCVTVGPIIVALSEVLQNTTIAVGKLDCDENGLNRDLFPERSIPNIKFFGGDKTKPIKYEVVNQFICLGWVIQ
eukprot:TRINITY_DN4464_c0_g2_i4.p1 TRINITY_DN4464_c0_g2~~TRINITY_DN4464_c0_g2_i4.p1  ORF type:complete len:331 (+),score=46.52 TRINITY_DN4464_c0_g2_i4:355-1347(+)